MFMFTGFEIAALMVFICDNMNGEQCFSGEFVGGKSDFFVLLFREVTY